MAHVSSAKTKRGEIRYVVRYRDPTGKQREQWFRSKRQADDRRKALEYELQHGDWIDPRQASQRFADVAAEWLSSNAAKRSSTLARDEAIVRVHLVPRFGRRLIGQINKRDVRAAVTEWTERRKPRTVKRIYGVLRAVLAYAVDNEYIAVTPCRGIKLPSADPIEAHVITADELAALAEAMGPNWGAMAYLGALLGLRWAECAGLRVRRLDLLNGSLTVAEQVVRGMHGQIDLGPPKSNASRRTLSLAQPLVEMLAAQLVRKGLTAANADAFVFAAQDGGPIRYESWRRHVWLPATERADLVGLRFHDLRRANATALVAAGVDLKTAQVRLGHTDPRLTLGVYAQAIPAAERDASERIASFFLKPPRGCRGVGA